jgi:hypothetical protein
MANRFPDSSSNIASAAAISSVPFAAEFFIRAQAFRASIQPLC